MRIPDSAREIKLKWFIQLSLSLWNFFWSKNIWQGFASYQRTLSWDRS